MYSRTAFTYDFLLVEGGAEKLTLQVKQDFPEMDMTVGFADRTVFPQADYSESSFRTLTSATSVRGWQGLKVMSAFKRKGGFLADYETVFHSGVYAPVAVRHCQDARNICYCHTPPRFVYDLRSHYLETAPAWQSALIRSLIPKVRKEYEQAMANMDIVVANSKNVRRRLEQYVGLSDVQVIHPPVDTKGYQWLDDGDYYLSTARLESYKRVNRIIDAFKQMPDRKLVVASGGSEMNRLRQLAHGHENISFTGWCSSTQMQELIGNCIATIYVPRDEDFGISPVESMAAGKPVIGVAEGGILETVVPDRTGVLIDPQNFLSGEASRTALAEAVTAMDIEKSRSMMDACKEQSAKFTEAVWRQKFARLLQGQ